MKYTKSGELCLSGTDRNDLLNLIDHVRKDMSYAEGGTYNVLDSKGNDYIFDKKGATSSDRAINIIKEIILQSKY